MGKTCCVNGCEHEATYKAQIILHAKGHKETEYEPVKLDFPAPFCEEHAALDAYDMLTETDWTRLCLEFYRQKRVQPDRLNVGIEWSRIGLSESVLQ